MFTQIDKRSGAQSLQEVKYTLADVVVAQLREEIISGKLGGGTMIAEIPTAERLGVSRVPVREALLVLEREGLLVFEQRGRCRVRTLTPRDMEEISAVRRLLEGESFRLAARHHTADDLVKLEANLDQMSRARTLARITLLDIEFHDLIVAAARQSRLQHLWQVMRGQIQLFTAELQREFEQKMQTVREVTLATHRKCLRVIRSRKEDAALEYGRQQFVKDLSGYKRLAAELTTDDDR